jgi:hypothetical protein
MRRVTVKDAHGPWFGSTAQPLKRGNGQRQAKVAKTIGEALSCGLAPFEAMRAVSDAAVGIRKAMNSRRGVSIWTSDSFLDEPLARWTGDLEGFVTRNPGGTLEDVSAAAWRAVESAVARERRRRTRSWVTLATMHAAKGREFDYTFVCGASLDTRHLKPSADGTACEAIRNLLLVGCSRSREKLLILHKAAEPCCILARLQGEPCPLAAGDHRGCPAQLSLAIQLEESSGPDFE